MPPKRAKPGNKKRSHNDSIGEKAEEEPAHKAPSSINVVSSTNATNNITDKLASSKLLDDIDQQTDSNDVKIIQLLLNSCDAKLIQSYLSTKQLACKAQIRLSAASDRPGSIHRLVLIEGHSVQQLTYAILSVLLIINYDKSQEFDTNNASNGLISVIANFLIDFPTYLNIKNNNTLEPMSKVSGSRIYTMMVPFPFSHQRLLSFEGNLNNFKQILPELCMLIQKDPKSVTTDYTPLHITGQYHDLSFFEDVQETMPIMSPFNPYGFVKLKESQQTVSNGEPAATDAVESTEDSRLGDSATGSTPQKADPAHVKALSTAGAITQHIYIPNDMVGAIIGKAGAKINEIRTQSGSFIKISEAPESGNQRLVSISGTPECNQIALYLLQTRLEQEKQDKYH